MYDELSLRIPCREGDLSTIECVIDVKRLVFILTAQLWYPYFGNYNSQ